MFARTQFETITDAYKALKREAAVLFDGYSMAPNGGAYGTVEFWKRPDGSQVIITENEDGTWYTDDLPGIAETGEFLLQPILEAA